MAVKEGAAFTVVANLHEVLRWEGLCDGDSEGDGVLVLGVRLLQQEVLVVQDVLAIAVLHQDPEGLHKAVHLLVPLKVWRDCQVHLHVMTWESGTGDCSSAAIHLNTFRKNNTFSDTQHLRRLRGKLQRQGIIQVSLRLPMLMSRKASQHCQPRPEVGSMTHRRGESAWPDLEDGAGDGLDVGAQLQARELVHEAVQGLAHLGQADELAQLLRAQVVVALPGQLLLLDALQDLLGDALELPQRRLHSVGSTFQRFATARGM